MPRYSRRSLLALGGMATAAVVFPVRDDPPAPDLASSLPPLRDRWREVTAGAGVTEAATAVARHLGTMAPARTSLWPTCRSPP
ncbi:hypothetical protein [Nonomuraea sp. LPB2021202275-12-8]|uniref:hypothetical protein n=1 Tax=Nonomuraea sp. LPB2021202275-12-8 TaxID=3120159 RepID=UPI00300CC24F